MYNTPQPPYTPQPPAPNYGAILAEKQQLRKGSSWLCFTLFCVFMAFMVFPSLVSTVFYGLTETNRTAYYGFSPLLYQLFSCVVYLLAVGAPGLLYFAIRKLSISEALPFEPVPMRTAVPLVLFGFGACLLANLPAGWVISLEDSAGFNTAQPPAYIQNSVGAQIFFFISMAIIPPIVEELLFRGIILHTLRRYGEGFAIVGSSLLFGLFHMDVAQFVFAFLCGLVLSFLVIKTNCLWLSIAVHFLNNALATIVELLDYYVGAQQANIIYAVFFIIIAVLGLLSLLALFLPNRSFFRLSANRSSLRLSQRFNALFINVWGILVILFSMYQAAYRLTAA